MPLQQMAEILKNYSLGDDLWLMDFLAPEIVETSQAGQFVQLKVSTEYDPLLRRPISIFDLDVNGGNMRLLYKIVGRGTRMMSQLPPGAKIDVMGPLGRGFNLQPPGSRVALVGGGVGIAPLLYLAKQLLSREHQVALYHGAATAAGLNLDAEFEQLNLNYIYSTDDGSKGYHGRITDLFTAQINRQNCDAVYTCGPEAMMAAVAAHCRQQGLWAELSLETTMACGMGACLGCACRLKAGDQRYAKVCQDGPVFSLEQLDLEPEGGNRA